jgi:hypothetical protein
MPRPVLLLAVLATALPLAAQDAPVTVTVTPNAPVATKAVKPPTPTGRITGTVLCADTHRPARGALLVVQAVPTADGTPNTATVGQNMGRVALDGSYSIEHLGPGQYSVMAILPGYISEMDDMISSEIQDHSPSAIRQELLRNGTVTITAGEVERYDLTIERGAAVSGHVLFSDGAPASQVSIEVEDVNAKKLSGPNAAQGKMAASMGRMMFTHQSQNTDDQGRFRIAGLRPGSYRVAAVSSLSNADDTADGMGGMIALLGGSFDPSALRVYSGDTLHAKSAKTYELRSGDEVTGIEITIPLNAYHQVKGTLTAVDGRTINRATLTLTDTTDDSVTFQTEVSEQGSFTFTTVAAGTYTLVAKDAKITAPLPGSDPNLPRRYASTKVTNAFADATTSVIVKDSDVPDITLTLTEVSLPPEPTLPANLDPDL